jgi:hypothetical protein
VALPDPWLKKKKMPFLRLWSWFSGRRAVSGRPPAIAELLGFSRELANGDGT